MNHQSPPQSALIFFCTVLAICLLRAQVGSIDPLLSTTAVGVAVIIAGWWALGDGRRWRRQALIVAASLTAVHAAIVVADQSLPDEHRLASWLGEDREYAEIGLQISEGPYFHEQAISFEAYLLDVDIDQDGELTERAPKVRVFYRTADLPPCSRLPLPGDRVTTWARMERFAPAYAPWRTSPRELMEGRGFVAAVQVQEPLQFDDDHDLSLSVRVMRSLTIHRIELERRLADHADGDAQAIATAMLTGSRGKLSQELREPFDITSTGHILAISGLHFAIVAGIIALLLRLFLDRFPQLYARIPRRVLVGLLTLAVLVAYLLAIGAPISARRAFGMTALAICAICFSPRRLSAISALAATAGILLLWRPTLVAEVGYQLSVAATAGIILFMRFRPDFLREPVIPGPSKEGPWRRRMRGVGVFFGVSISATVATWPVLLPMTGEIPVAGLWANLVVVPLVGSVLFPILVVGALLSGLWPALAGILIALSTGGLLVIQAALDQVAYWPGTVIRWGTPSTLETIGLFLASGIAIMGGLRPRALMAALITGLLFFAPSPIVDRLSPPTATVHFIDVGQGDATLVELPDGTTVLIDGGGRPVGSDPGLQRVVPYLRHRGISRLDAVVLTHGDYDHYGGLTAVVRPFRPHAFYVDADEDNERVQQLRQKMADHDVEIVGVTDREVISGGVDLTIYRPDLPEASDNDRSLVADFSFAGAGVLLPGDLEAAGERWLVDEISGPRAVLKAPHHGSNTSSSAELIDHFRPALAVSSSGRHNRFGHPHPDVVERYEERGVDLYRIDQRGSVIVEIDVEGVIRVW